MEPTEKSPILQQTLDLKKHRKGPTSHSEFTISTFMDSDEEQDQPTRPHRRSGIFRKRARTVKTFFLEQVLQMSNLQKCKIVILVVAVVTAAIIFRSKPEEEHVEPPHGALPYSVGPGETITVSVGKDSTTHEYVDCWLAFYPHHNLLPEPHLVGSLQFDLEGDVGTANPRLLDKHTVEVNDKTADEAIKFMLDGKGSIKQHESHMKITYNVPAGQQAYDLAFTMRLHSLPLMVRYQEAIAAIVLAGVYVLIIFELVHRTLAALVGSFVALAAISLLKERPSLEHTISWIDFETVCLLVGMMLMVGIFSKTGFFEWCAVRAYKFSKGNVWHLVLILCIGTAVVSAFLDNVTTMLLITPVTIRLCKVIDLKPQPILIAEVIFSNIGGTATAIGDPPNVLIISSKYIKRYEIGFGEFSLHMAIGAIFAMIAAIPLIWWLLRGVLVQQPHQATGIRNEIRVWELSIKKLALHTEEEDILKEKLRTHIAKLQEELEEVQAEEGDGEPVDIAELEEQYQIKDVPLFIQCCVVLVVVILLFFLQSVIEGMYLDLAWISLIGSITLLVLSGHNDMEEILAEVEWATLMFFAGLFVLMEALVELGLIGWIGNQTTKLISEVPKDNQLLVAIIVLLWVSAFASAFIDNIPYTAAMIPIVVQLSESLDLPVRPLVYSLAFGTCLGGNGTLIGASANVVTAGLVEQHGYSITFTKFMRTGMPIMVLSIVVATVYLLIAHVAIGWNCPCGPF